MLDCFYKFILSKKIIIYIKIIHQFLEKIVSYYIFDVIIV